MISLVQFARNDPIYFQVKYKSHYFTFLKAQGRAFLQGRDYVIPDDVKMIAPYVLIHRIRVKPEAEIDYVTPKAVAERILQGVPVPKT